MTSYLAIHMIKTRPSLSLQIVRIAGCSSKIEELNNDKGYLTYELNLDGWTKLTGETDVWYREVLFSTSNQPFKLLKDDQISVNQDRVDKAAAAAFKENPDTIPSLSFYSLCGTAGQPYS